MNNPDISFQLHLPLNPNLLEHRRCRRHRLLRRRPLRQEPHEAATAELGRQDQVGNSIEKLKSQLTSQLCFQLSFLVLCSTKKTQLKTRSKSQLRFQFFCRIAPQDGGGGRELAEEGGR